MNASSICSITDATCPTFSMIATLYYRGTSQTPDHPYGAAWGSSLHLGFMLQLAQYPRGIECTERQKYNVTVVYRGAEHLQGNDSGRRCDADSRSEDTSRVLQRRQASPVVFEVDSSIRDNEIMQRMHDQH